MSSTITLSAATRQNLLSLQDTANLLSTTQNRLSTGKKVNSALDNPVNFFTSQSLTARSGDLASILDGVSNGIQAIQAASTGITNIQKLVDSAKSTANQALSTQVSTTGTASAAFGNARAATVAGPGTPAAAGTRTGTTIGDGTGTTATLLNNTTAGPGFASGNTFTINGQAFTITDAGTGAQNATSVRADDTIQDLLTKINAVAGATQTLTFTGGKFTLTGKTTADGINTGTGTAKFGFTPGDTVAATPPVAATTAQPATREAAAASTVTFKVDGVAKSYAIAANQKIDDVIAGLNLAAGSNIFSKDTTSGSKLVVNSSANVEITDAASRTALGFAGAGTNQSTDLTVTGATTRANLATQYNDLLDQIDQLAKDASFNGVNLLNSNDKTNTLRIAFNETNTSNIDVRGVDGRSAGLGLSRIDTTAGGAGNFQSSDAIKSTIVDLNSATTTLRTYSSTFGSNLTVAQNRQDFTKNIMNVLDTGSSNLVNADMNEEAANSQALSTRNSLAISALSLANQAQQGILQLLR